MGTWSKFAIFENVYKYFAIFFFNTVWYVLYRVSTRCKWNIFQRNANYRNKIVVYYSLEHIQKVYFVLSPNSDVSSFQ